MPNVIHGDANDNSLFGTSGDDDISGFAGNDFIEGDAGNDTLRGGDGHDNLFGGNGHDILFGDGDSDYLQGGLGNDSIDGGAGYNVAAYAVGWGGPASFAAGENLAAFDDGQGGTDTLTNIEEIHIYGGGFNDVLVGNSLPNWISGNGGDDTLTGGNGNDTFAYDVTLANGNDTIVDLAAGEALQFYVPGTENQFAITSIVLGDNPSGLLSGQVMIGTPSGGTTMVYVGIDGNAGADITITLQGSYAAANFYASNDLFRGSLDYEPGQLIVGTAGGDHLSGGDYNDTIQGLAGTDNLLGGGGDDLLQGGTDMDFLLGGPGNDTIDGGVILDRVNYTDLNFVSYSPAASGAFIDLSGITGDGSSGSGTASDGDGGSDMLINVNFAIGSSFNDHIIGSSAAIFEQFEGGLGDDTIDGGTIDGVTGSNSNRVTYQNAGAAVSVDFAARTATGGHGADTLININYVRATSFADLLLGCDTNAYTEIFEGRGGNDTIDGRGGTDMVRYDAATGGVDVNLMTGIASDGQGGTDILSRIEGVRGTGFNDTLTGGNPANGTGITDGFEFFTGSGGNDTIDGGGGFDRADYTTSTIGAVVTLGGTGVGTAFDGLGGIDTLISIEAVRGSDFNDTLTGSDSGTFESFEGRAGNDLIDGKGGADRADYTSSISAVNVNLALQTAQDGFGGTDTLLNIENIRGSSFNDVIVGDGFANRLEGGPGNDALTGGAGSDRFVLAFGSVDTITDFQAGVGGDLFDANAPLTNDPNVNLFTAGYLRLSQSGANALLEVDADGSGGPGAFETLAILLNIDKNAITGANFVTGSDPSGGFVRSGTSGNDTLSGSAQADTLSGAAGNDWLYGEAGADLLLGGDGQNELFGGAGDDSLSGGAGDDGLQGDGGNDILDGGAGFDSVNYDLATGGISVNLKTGVASGADGNDVLTSIEAVSGSGFADTLTGSDGDDIIAGRQGNDVLDGGAGFDFLHYGDAPGAVTVNLATSVVSGADGVDTIVNFEGVVGSAFGDSLTGDANVNRLEGDAGDDTLRGNGGNDTLYGGDGIDTAVFTGNRADYTISFNPATGVRTVRDSVLGRDGTDILVSVETLQFADGVATSSFIKIDPAGTYLSTAVEDPANTATIVLLSDLGLSAGDYITLTRIGDYQAGPVGFSDTSTGLLAVFWDGSGFVAPEVHAQFVSLRQATTQVSTDVAQDFFVVGRGVTMVKIPAGATSLYFSPNDSFFSDNLDPDSDYGVIVEAVTASSTFIGGDALYGTTAPDSLSGGAGQDTLLGGAGNDTLDGGAILDRSNYTDLNVVIYATSPAGVNIDLSGITGDGGSGAGSASDGFGGTDVLRNLNFITGSNFNDTITGSSALIFEQFTGGGGDDIIDGGAIDPISQLNSNRVDYSAATSFVTVTLGAVGIATGGGVGTDTLYNINHVRGSNFGDFLTGSGLFFTEQFEGRGGNDTIDGGAGTDMVRYDSSAAGINVNLATGIGFDGLGGTDTLLNIEGIRGSNFDDVLSGGNPDNGSGSSDGFEFFIGNAGNDTIDGCGGYDRVDYNTSTSGVVVTLGGASNGTASDGLGGVDTLISIEAVRASTFNDTLTGSDSGIFESFDGREGSDSIDGKGGTDRVDYANAASAVNVNLALHTAQDGWGGTDTLLNIEDVRGSSFNDVITGDANSNKLEGGTGNDTILAGAGEDTVIGGTGNDVLDGGANDPSLGFDWVSYASASGPVNVNLATSLATGADGNDTLTGFEGVMGSAFGDSLTGGAGDDILRGNAGNDTIEGGGGVDWIDYSAAAGSVMVSLASGTSSGDDGEDVFTGIERVRGGSFNDALTGDAGDNRLRGNGGDDLLDGGLGNDAADYRNATGSVIVDLGAGSSSGADGNDTLISIEHAFGSFSYADTLIGSEGNNELDGRGGNDSLSGLAGDDTLTGGAGDDTLDGGEGTDTAGYTGSVGQYVISVGDLAGELVVSGPEGTDLLRSIEFLQFADFTYSYRAGTAAAETITALPAEGSVIIDAGAGDDVLAANDTGNVLLGGQGADSLVGGTGSDMLNGGTGSDTMAGGDGDDVYIVDSDSDVVIEEDAPGFQPLGQGFRLVEQGFPFGVLSLGGSIGGSIDKVVASINYQLGSFVENLTLRGTALIGTGNELGNVLAGNAEGNILSGLAGKDTLLGGDGDDTLDGGAGNDAIDGESGIDTAVFAGNRAAYAVQWHASSQSFTVSSVSEGTDTLTHVEWLQFNDATFSVESLMDTLAPSLSSFSPADEAVGVAVDSNLALTFSEAIARGTGTIRLTTQDGAVVETFDATISDRITISGNTLTLDPSANLAWATVFTLQLPAGSVQDLADNTWAGSDSYNFTTGGRLVSGTAGNDLLQGTLGNDTFSGSTGTDTVIASLLPSQYQYSAGVLSGPEGLDSLLSMEKVRFGGAMGSVFTSDLTLDWLVDPDGAGHLPSPAASLLESITDLYVAYFNRAPDVTGLMYWFRNVSSGEWRLDEVASSFTDQPEYQLAYPPGTNSRDFVEKIYQNLFDRQPDQQGWDYWVAELQASIIPRDSFILTVIRGAYAPTGGAEDKLLLNHKHEASLYYSEQLALNPGEPFDARTDLMLNRVSADPATVLQARGVVDYLMTTQVGLTGLSSDTISWESFWS